jgi:putative FmdB family regulatory protein
VPTYQYACTACGEQHEAVQAFTDAPLTECPACGGRLRKVFGAVGVVFKGSGFYKTDSRAGAKTGSAGESTGGKADGSAQTKSDGAAKTDSTPAAAASTPVAKTA